MNNNKCYVLTKQEILNLIESVVYIHDDYNRSSKEHEIIAEEHFNKQFVPQLEEGKLYNFIPKAKTNG